MTRSPERSIRPRRSTAQYTGRAAALPLPREQPHYRLIMLQTARDWLSGQAFKVLAVRMDDVSGMLHGFTVCSIAIVAQNVALGGIGGLLLLILIVWLLVGQV